MDTPFKPLQTTNLCANTQYTLLSFTEQLLQDTDKLSVLFTAENAQIVQFTLKYKPPLSTTAVLRVYHQIDQDFETFQSLIVSPSMTADDVIQLSLARIALDVSHDVSHDQFELVLRTTEGGMSLDTIILPLYNTGKSLIVAPLRAPYL